VEPYAPRRVRSHGIRDANGWRLKLYSIVRDGSAPDWTTFEPGIASAVDALPTPARAPGRAGLGFVIAHAGRDVWYTVLGWWDRENELPLRVWVAERDASSVPRWRQAQGSESVCVWDLDVIWHERQAYVDTMLSNQDGDWAEHEYLSRVIERTN
jgi:hypothetical protein